MKSYIEALLDLIKQETVVTVDHKYGQMAAFIEDRGPFDANVDSDGNISLSKTEDMTLGCIATSACFEFFIKGDLVKLIAPEDIQIIQPNLVRVSITQPEISIHLIIKGDLRDLLLALVTELAPAPEFIPFTPEETFAIRQAVENYNRLWESAGFDPIGTVKAIVETFKYKSWVDFGE